MTAAAAVSLPPGARCALCGVVLAGAVAWDQHRRVFCAHHRDAGRHCRHCDRFFLPGNRSKEACEACAATRVDDPLAATRVCAEAAGWFAANGVKLATRPGVQLQAVMPASPLQAGTRMLGYTAQSRGAGRHDARIVLAAGLPMAVLRMVMVHELGHVAIGDAGLRLPTPIEEGACDWLAHRYLGTLGDAEALVQRRRIETRTDPVYGLGFRTVSQRLAGGSPRDLLPLLRSLQVLPCR